MIKETVKNFSPKKIVTIILLTVAVFVVYSNLNSGGYKDSGSLKATALSIVNECEGSSYRPYCYEKEVPRLLGKLNTYEAFDLIREIRKIDTEYVFCHVLAHEIGQYEVSLDPNNWLEAFARGPVDGLCSNGYAHGAILARFNQEYFDSEQMEMIKPELAIACEERDGWNPTNLQRAMCYHGMGHVLVHLTDADVARAIDICEEISVKTNGDDFREVCHEGVYMQLFQPLEPEDEALINQLKTKPAKDNIKEFCAEYSNTEEDFGACWREAWPFFEAELKTSGGIMSYCGQLDNEYTKDRCLISAITIDARQNLGSPVKLKEICDGFSLAYKKECYARSANAYLEEDQGLIGDGVAFCALAEENEVRGHCYGFLADLAEFNFHRDSQAYNDLCYTLPEPWNDFCRP